MYSIIYYNMINIRVLLIIRVLLLKHFGDLDFECYIYIYIYIIYVCVCRERGNFFKKRNGDFCVERERGRHLKKKKEKEMET
jgi:hypothetical protein